MNPYAEAVTRKPSKGLRRAATRRQPMRYPRITVALTFDVAKVIVAIAILIATLKA